MHASKFWLSWRMPGSRTPERTQVLSGRKRSEPEKDVEESAFNARRSFFCAEGNGYGGVDGATEAMHQVPLGHVTERIANDAAITLTADEVVAAGLGSTIKDLCVGVKHMQSIALELEAGMQDVSREAELNAAASALALEDAIADRSLIGADLQELADEVAQLKECLLASEAQVCFCARACCFVHAHEGVSRQVTCEQGAGAAGQA